MENTYDAILTWICKKRKRKKKVLFQPFYVKLMYVRLKYVFKHASEFDENDIYIFGNNALNIKCIFHFFFEVLRIITNMSQNDFRYEYI